MLSSFVTLGVGFVVRPFGALFFGRIGDLVGRKYTFLITITVMGLSTALVGILPTFSSIGWVAPIILVLLRTTQGLALGGEYGGAATYVAEICLRANVASLPAGFKRLLAWVLSLTGRHMDLPGFCFLLRPSKVWGWRIPFLLSVALLGSPFTFD